MSTFIRITTSVILFTILFTYEWIHIKGEIKNHKKNDNEYTTYEFLFTKKQYIIFAAICYGILNIAIVNLFIFSFPDYIFLCTRKLFVVGGIILTFIFINLSFFYGIEIDAKIKEIIFIVLGAISFALVIINFINPSIDTVEIGRTENSKTMYLVTSVSKYLDTNNKNMYAITFKDKWPLIIKENDIHEFNFSVDTYVICNTVTTYYENTEKKEKEEFQEQKTTYDILVNKNLFIDYSKK